MLHSRKTWPAWSLVAVLGIGACATRGPSLVDPLDTEMIDEDATLVASSREARQPLLFVAPEEGTVYFLAYNDLLATFKIEEGQRVELNASEIGPAMSTRITVDGEEVLVQERTRSLVNRFYFLPDRKR